MMMCCWKTQITSRAKRGSYCGFQQQPTSDAKKKLRKPEFPQNELNLHCKYDTFNSRAKVRNLFGTASQAYTKTDCVESSGKCKIT